MLNQKEDATSLTNQLDTPLHGNNVVKLGMRRSFVETYLRPQAVPRGGGNSLRPTSQPYRVGCTAQVERLSDEAKAKNEEYLGLKSGEKIKVVRNDAYLNNESRKCIPLGNGKVGENEVEVLCDTDCNDVIVRKELMKDDDFTGSMGYVMAIDRTLKETRHPLLRLKWTRPTIRE